MSKRPVTKIVVLAMGFIAILASSPSVQGQATPGRIWAWGGNVWGQCDVPPPNSEFIMVSACAGGWHSLGLKPNGSIVAWGHYPWGDYGQCNVPAPNSGFVAISAGGYHSLGLKSDGSIVAWGCNDNGQCAVPDPNSGFIAISAGGYHSLGLKSDGSIVAWGYNLNGQLSIPAPNSGFVAISAGGYHSLGLRSDGSIAAWGRYSQYYGECDVPSPNSGFTALAAGVCHSLAIRSDGSIAAWGRNENGQCDVPQPNSGFIAVAGGCNHSLGLKSDGSVVAWGSNDYGQCVSPTEGCFVAVSAGVLYSLALEGYVYEGFFSPIDNNSINRAHAGQSIPIIWKITDKDGTPISDPASFSSVKSYAVDCESYANDPASIIDEPAAGSSGLQYLSDGLWQYNWKTSKLYKGQCRILRLTLSDHSVHTANFSFQ